MGELPDARLPGEDRTPAGADAPPTPRAQGGWYILFSGVLMLLLAALSLALPPVT